MNFSDLENELVLSRAIQHFESTYTVSLLEPAIRTGFASKEEVDEFWDWADSGEDAREIDSRMKSTYFMFSCFLLLFYGEEF